MIALRGNDRAALQAFSTVLLLPHVFEALDDHFKSLVSIHELFSRIERNQEYLFLVFMSGKVVGCVWGELIEDRFMAHMAFNRKCDVQEAFRLIAPLMTDIGAVYVEGVIPQKNRASRWSFRRFGAEYVGKRYVNGEECFTYIKEL